MIATILLWLPAALTAVLTAHTAINARLLRRPVASSTTVDTTVDTTVAVLLPLRDEADRVEPCLRALLAQRGVPRLRILVLDDDSRDGTAEAVRAITAHDPRLRLLTGTAPPPGWLGKPHACHQLAEAVGPTAEVLVFVDADVILAPHAIAAATALLTGFDLVSPYPALTAAGPGERLIQPLLPWSWLTFLPLRAMERSPRPALAAAGGQFLAVTRAGYRAAGGHAAVRDQVLEDVALARAVKRAGGRIALADGSRLARCRMYTSWPALVDGYTKSLWAAFGSSAGAAAVALLLLFGYACPPLLAVVGLVTGAPAALAAGGCAYLLGVLGRVFAGRATGARTWPDALAQPISIVLFVGLLARSYRRRRLGRLSWKGRRIAPDGLARERV